MNIFINMMLGSKGTNPIVLAQIGFGTCDPPEHEEVAEWTEHGESSLLRSHA